MFEAVQSRVHSALLDVQRVKGHLLNSQQHAVAMFGTERNGLQYQ